MEDSLISGMSPVAKRVVPYIVSVVIGGAGIGYAVHEHHNAQTLATQNSQVTAQLNATHSQLDTLTAKVNALAASNQAKATAPPAPPPAVVATSSRPAVHHATTQDSRYKKLQSQVDAQGKAIEDTRSDLDNTRTELTGSIARTHDELVVLEKKGERNYYEFDLQKSKQFQRQGPVSISLRKANTKHQYADLALMVDDRNLSQKHVNLYQPVMFYQPDSPQPVEIVINDITKDHIHGYVSASKYRQSELTAAANPAPGPDQAANPNPTAQPQPRQKLPLPNSEPNQ